MYPDNQSIELFGEAVSWPGVGKDGKFTNGSFSDPEVRPSFIPAETVNLVLDNLSELLTSLGKTPNNADPSQLKEAVTAALALKAPLAGPVFTGVVEVPSKTSAAANDGTLIATEAQVYLKENAANKKTTVTDSDTDFPTGKAVKTQLDLKAPLASPAFTGTPTVPTAAAAKTNNTQAASCAYADRAGHPVGSYYTQYPETGQSTIAGMFPAAKSPATLFGGTWTERYASEDVFFRTGALGTRRGQIWNDSLTWNPTNHKYTATGATVGIEPDAIRNILGSAGHFPASAETEEGVLTMSGSQNIATTGNAYQTQLLLFNASRAVPTDTANHPKNRLIKVWERTA
jgi:hypothetical protein